MTQKVDYNNITNTLVNILASANTTTAAYDLSTGLTRRVQQVNRDDLFIVPKFKPLYPLVAVTLESKRESIVGYNNNRRDRTLDLVYRIICLHEKFVDGEKEVWNLARNVDTILRENPTLGDYNHDLKALMVLPTGVSFSIEFLGAGISNFLFKALITNESAFTKATQINCTVKCYLDDAEVV
jgi:hypothetical protein